MQKSLAKNVSPVRYYRKLNDRNMQETLDFEFMKKVAVGINYSMVELEK